MKEMRNSVKKYFDGIKLFKNSKGMFSGDTPKLGNLLFAGGESDAEIKAKKFNTIINTYTKGNRDNWENFSEIYILGHISLKNMQKYIELKSKYDKISDLNAKVENLENVLKVFYQRVDDIGKCTETLSKCYKDINSFLKDPFLLDIQKTVMDRDFVGNFKTLLQNLVEISDMYASDEAMELCKKYEYLIQDESGSSIKKFFSSMINCVYFIRDYNRLNLNQKKVTKKRKVKR